jgi:hypothetical protein
MYEHVFDRLLEAIDRAAGAADYVRDRYYLPWQSELAARRRDNRTGPPGTHEHEITPGLLLFRRDCRASPRNTTCEPGLLAIVLVGETSAWGVHHQVLERALVVADTFEIEAATRPLRILGPTFSGSVSSLRDALDRYPCKHTMRHTGFHVVTGEATNARNKTVMKVDWPSHTCRVASGASPTIDYHATVTDDEPDHAALLFVAGRHDGPVRQAKVRAHVRAGRRRHPQGDRQRVLTRVRPRSR